MSAACSGDAGASTTARVRIAAAADLRFALDEIMAAWAATNPRFEVEAVYGSSGSFVAQIRQGAPFDVFFSADAAYPRALEADGIVGQGATRVYGIGQIVVWVSASLTLDVRSRGLEALTDPTVRAVAIANPEHAPYGRAAVEALTSAGLYDAVEPKLVLGENAAQATQFVESGNADAGIIPLALALGPVMRDAGRHAVVPIDSYQRLEQGVAVLATARDPDAARAFVEFTLGPVGLASLDRYGFLPPP